LGEEVTSAVLDDYATAPIDRKLRVTLAFLEKLTLHPYELGADDVRELLAAGVTRAQVRDATWVATLFNIYPRLADSLGWHVPGKDQFGAAAKRLLTRGYK
jgi:alkylhydroperoxidase family enzyme